MIPPVLITVRIRSGERGGFMIPLPFVLFWPVVVLVPLLFLPLLALVEAVLMFTPYRYPATQVVIRYLDLLGSLRGMKLFIKSKSERNGVAVSIM